MSTQSHSTKQITRECPPWCDGTGHADWLPIEDHVHRSDEHYVPLSLPQFFPGGLPGNWHGEEVRAGLWRGYGEETSVMVVMSDNVEIKLTVAEARLLAQHITAECDQTVTTA